MYVCIIIIIIIIVEFLVHYLQNGQWRITIVHKVKMHIK